MPPNHHPDAIVECVPNFSEGTDAAKVAQIVSAMRVDQVRLLDWSLDAAHNRSVVTIAGPPAAVLESAIRGAGRASQLIDLTLQSGVHPRIGAADVIPFVPVADISLAECVLLARQAGMEIWRRYGVPVYFYESAAARPDRVQLEDVRRGQFEDLRTSAHRDASRRPDVGGPAVHPTAGASAVGARSFLIAYNIYLDLAEPGTDLHQAQGQPRAPRKDVTAARAIARAIRASSGGMYGVKAMGVVVNGRAQVTMNITDFNVTPMPYVHATVQRLAQEQGVRMAAGELIGLIPEAAYTPEAAWAREIPDFDAEQKILQRKLHHPMPWPVL